MSGHSKWAKIHRQKGINDQQRGKIFTKLGRAITIAVKEGGGVTDPDFNFKLRLAVDKAKQANMPNVNIEKAIKSGSGAGSGENWENITYEGYGPEQAAVIVEVVTDNRNRALSEIKQIFDKSGGILGQPGSVNFLFDRVGEILIGKPDLSEGIILQIMDIPGVEDVETSADGVSITTDPSKLKQVQAAVKKLELPVSEAGLNMKPKIHKELDNKQIEKVAAFIEKLENSDEVQEVYCDVIIN